ncbi:MAG: WecB/TagA/CpsF family glycosyltransferase [Lachnospiraceae bacterium]
MEVLGISLSNVGLREAIRRSEGYLRQGRLNTIAYVSTKKLIEASENEEQRIWWEKLDLTICEDTEVLKAAGAVSYNRLKEIEENSFLKEFLKLLARRHTSVLLLAEDEERLKLLEEELRHIQSNLFVVGRDTTDYYRENKEGLINAINAQAPGVILSRLPYPEGIHLMYDYHSYLNSSVWLTLPETLVKSETEGWKEKMADLIYRKLLNKKLHRFAQEKERQ